MGAVFSIVLSTLSLTLASRIMNVSLGIIPALLVVAFFHGVGAVFEGTEKPLYTVGVIISLVVYFAGLKRVTGENIWTLAKMTILSFILIMVIFQVFARTLDVSANLFLGK